MLSRNKRSAVLSKDIEIPANGFLNIGRGLLDGLPLAKAAGEFRNFCDITSILGVVSEHDLESHTPIIAAFGGSI